jgi:hydroxyacylglutathione hydrolase
MKIFNYYESHKISDSVTRIFGPTGELMYLIEGNKRAALIDTGAGVGDLKAFVDSLTSKPYFVILTHGHVDHALGAPSFDEVYMNMLDREVYKAHSEISVRKNYLKMNMGDNFEKIKEEDYIPVAPC